MLKDKPLSLTGLPRRSTNKQLKRNLTAYAFIAPAVILYAILGVYTVGYGIALSFFRWNGFAPRWIWMGLDNFKDFLYANPNVSRVFWEAARNNVVLMIALPVGVILISLPLAIALNNVKRFAALFRSIFFLPLVTSGIAVYYVWRWIYEPSGLLNTLLRGVGLGFLAPENGFLGSINMALPAVIWVMIWSSVPFAIILYLTGLQAIDQALFDAARVDGATRFQILRRVLWPLLYPTTGIIVILNLNTALQGFETVLLMTNGGPTNHTNILGLMIYNTAFQQGDLGLASALGWSLFVLSFGIAFINLRVFRQQT